MVKEHPRVTEARNAQLAKLPALLREARLSDGSLALYTARRNKIGDQVFLNRLKQGLAPDEAVLPVVKQLSAFERGEYPTPFDVTFSARKAWTLKQIQRCIKSRDKRKARLDGTDERIAQIKAGLADCIQSRDVSEMSNMIASLQVAQLERERQCVELDNATQKLADLLPLAEEFRETAWKWAGLAEFFPRPCDNGATRGE